MLDSTDAAPNGLACLDAYDRARHGHETPMVRLRLYAAAGRQPARPHGLVYLDATVIAATRYSLTFEFHPTVVPGSVFRFWFGTARADLPEEAEVTQASYRVGGHTDDLGLGFNGRPRLALPRTSTT